MYSQFNFVFLFDHSSGHSKKRISGLDASSVNKEFGGAQPIMRTSEMEAEDGLLGPFDRILSVGEVQGMQFLPADPGPFWMTSREQEDCQHNRTRPDRTTATRRDKTKKELAEELSFLVQSLILGSKSLKNFKKWLGSKTFQLKRISKASSRAGKGNRKDCCRSFGSAGGLISQSSMNI
jgi:hypothetical protein